MSPITYVRFRCSQVVAPFIAIWRTFKPTFEEARSRAEAPETERSKINDRERRLRLAISRLKDTPKGLDGREFEQAITLCEKEIKELETAGGSKNVRTDLWLAIQFLESWDREAKKAIRLAIEDCFRGQDPRAAEVPESAQAV